MKKEMIRLVIVGAVLVFAFLSRAALAENLERMITSDGYEINSLFIGEDSSLKPSLSPGFQGTGVISEEILQELEQQPGMIFQTPDGTPFEAVRPMTPYPGEEMHEVIKGWDTRRRNYTNNYPARAVVYITFNKPDGTPVSCSGWMISRDTVATAGHCVHTGGSSGNWCYNWTIYPGRDGFDSPYGSTTASWAASVSGWVDRRNEAYDYGVLKLNTDIGDATGWFGFLWRSGSKGLLNAPAIIPGYPGDKPDGEQWESADKVRISWNRQIFYYNDTAGGMSGSPIWYDKGNKGPYGIGIHAYGFPHKDWPHTKYNHGTRINETRFNNLKSWINEPK